MSKSVDITTLPNYESIPLGTHELTVTAQADGYTDSDPSAEVTFINGYDIDVIHASCDYTPTINMVPVFKDTVLTFTAHTGYNLPDTVTVTGASYTWDKSTGKLTLSNVTGAAYVYVAASMPQLATPTNVSVDGTVLSWDAVENAESYDIYAGNTLIGNTDGGG